jgi:hypothetical protein
VCIHKRTHTRIYAAVAGRSELRQRFEYQSQKSMPWHIYFIKSLYADFFRTHMHTNTPHTHTHNMYAYITNARIQICRRRRLITLGGARWGRRRRAPTALSMRRKLLFASCCRTLESRVCVCVFLFVWVGGWVSSIDRNRARHTHPRRERIVRDAAAQ